MQIDWQAFTPGAALAGGALIGLAIAGFVVGMGTQYGSGCTSGHGVCRISRLAGFCPGPALVALGTGSLEALVFVASMIAGMWAFQVIERAR